MLSFFSFFCPLPVLAKIFAAPPRPILPSLSLALARSLALSPEGHLLGSLVAFKATEGKKSSSISLLLVPRARAHRRRHAQGREKGRRRLWRRQEERRRKQKGEQFVNVAGVIVVVGVGIFIDSSRRRPDFVVVWPFCLRYGRGSGPAWPHQPREHLLL